MKQIGFYLFLLFAITGCSDSPDGPSGTSEYPLHQGITSTLFWVGEPGSAANKNIPNIASAWDDMWMQNFGGVDSPDHRNDYAPALFVPRENPFYVALPFNDFDAQGVHKSDLASYVPWASGQDDPANSLLKNRWIKIRKGDKTAYAQWEDVGPFGEDDWPYVFSSSAPRNAINQHAGLDVSPAVRDYLALADIDQVDWQFIDSAQVPAGPWQQVVTRSPVNWVDWYRPPVKTTWQWELQSPVNTGYDVDLYDIDLFESSAELIESLHQQGRKVICYFSAGSYENWRSDIGDFPAAAIGNPLDDWEGEKWLDIRSQAILAIMQQRLDQAVTKGCDGVEPDNVDGYLNRSGFALTAEDQLDFNRFLADQAHQRGLSIGLKNDLDQIPVLVPFFDFSVNEQCHQYQECEAMQPFIAAGKPVFNAEYLQKYIDNTQGERDELCADAISRKFQTLVLPLLLDDSFRFSCGD